jgi:protein-disulfide isomerase
MKIMTTTFAAPAFALLLITAYAADGPVLKPPPGARAAIVVFEDLECPDCSRAYPVIWNAANEHHVPVVLHDFPLTNMHPWAFDAAVYARYFDTKSEKLGNDFRGYIYSNQSLINKGNLQQYVSKFANDNKVPLPFVIDPDGKLKDKVNADVSLGNQLKVQHTPTIFVVGNGANGPPAEVTDRSQLGQIVEDTLAKSPPVKANTPAKSGAAKVKKKKSSTPK